MPENTEKNSREKLTALRNRFADHGIDGFLVPRADEWQGEYVAACAERLAWLTGFTGSAGTAIVLEDQAAAFSDGRYEEQIRRQVDDALFTPRTLDRDKGITPGDWLLQNTAEGARIGYDPRLHTIKEIAALESKLKEKNIRLLPVESNPVDEIWSDQPHPPKGKLRVFPEKTAGKTGAEKRAEIAGMLQDKKVAAALLTAPDSIAWLLNIRGRDIPHVPVPLCFALVYDDGRVDLFIDPDKVTPESRSHMGRDVTIHNIRDMERDLAEMAGAWAAEDQAVLIDEAITPVSFKTLLDDAGVKAVAETDPCILPKACKTAAEQDSIRETHIKDGVAMVKFLKWVDDEVPAGRYSELDIEHKLLAFRKQQDGFQETSFDTIAGWGPNGAVVHYRATPETSLTVTPPGLLLVDSGGQYDGGTTDITRTIAIGSPDEAMKDAFTRVLKGHIAIARQTFPAGTTGRDIDTLARGALWAANLDFKHGTGHGVGCNLSVHERGAGISRLAEWAFKPGMLVSNEPGYYKAGNFGIRIENLIMTEEAGKNEVTGALMMAFNTVSLAPIDLRLIDTALLNEDEVAWLNAYHLSVFKTLKPYLDEDEVAWLAKATRRIEKAPDYPAPSRKEGPESSPEPS